MISIPQALEAQAALAVQRADSVRSPLRFLVSSGFAGAFVGVGIVMMVSAAGPLLAQGDPLAKLVSALVFGVALTLVVFGGGELATSGMMILPQGAAMRSVGGPRAAGAVLASFGGNLVGAFAFAAAVVASGVLHANAPAGKMLAAILAAKAQATPAELFARGILCNVLVCLAVWMGNRATSDVARILLIYIAISAFVASGFEHVVANMTAYSLGLILGDPNAGAGAFAGNLLWVGAGNLVGGLIVGLGFWVIAGRPQVEVPAGAIEIAADASDAADSDLGPVAVAEPGQDRIIDRDRPAAL